MQRLIKVLQPIRLVQSDHRVLDCDGALFAELAKGSGDRLAGGAGHRRHFLVGEKERETKSSIHVLADLVGEFEEEAAKAPSHSFSKGDAAGVLQCKAVFLAETLNGPHLGFTVIAEEGQKPLTLYGTKLGRRQRFSGNLIHSVRKRCIETQDRAGTGNAHDHLTILNAARSQLEVASADQIQAAGVFALAEQGCLGRQADGAGDQFKICQYGASEGAEPAGPAIRARRTADGRLAADAFRPSLSGRCNT